MVATPLDATWLGTGRRSTSTVRGRIDRQQLVVRECPDEPVRRDGDVVGAGCGPQLGCDTVGDRVDTPDKPLVRLRDPDRVRRRRQVAGVAAQRDLGGDITGIGIDPQDRGPAGRADPERTEAGREVADRAAEGEVPDMLTGLSVAAVRPLLDVGDEPDRRSSRGAEAIGRAVVVDVRDDIGIGSTASSSRTPSRHCTAGRQPQRRRGRGSAAHAVELDRGSTDPSAGRCAADTRLVAHHRLPSRSEGRGLRVELERGIDAAVERDQALPAGEAGGS